MYKLIACDLDETLLNDDAKVCQRNREAIKKATELGVKFVPTTGRGFNAIQGTLTELGLKNQANEYVISFNGGCISENKGNQVLQFIGLSFPRANELFNFGKTLDVCIHVYTKALVYLYNADQDEFDYMSKRYKIKLMDIGSDLDFLNGQEIPKIIFANTNMNYLKEIASKYQDELSDLDISYSSNRFLELNHAGVNKGTGLKRLANKLNIDMSETMAIGDNLNDLSMIRAAGIGIGVKNIIPEMRADVDYLTKADNNEGGVAEAIEKFILNKK